MAQAFDAAARARDAAVARVQTRQPASSGTCGAQTKWTIARAV
jgi:hypothetical protein